MPAGWPNSLPSLGGATARVPLPRSLPPHNGIAALTSSRPPREALPTVAAAGSAPPPYAPALGGTVETTEPRAEPRPQAFPGGWPRPVPPGRAPPPIPGPFPVPQAQKPPGRVRRALGGELSTLSRGVAPFCPCAHPLIAAGTAVRRGGPSRDDSSRGTVALSRAPCVSSPGERSLG